MYKLAGVSCGATANKMAVFASQLCALEHHNTGTCITLQGVREPHVEDSAFDSAVAVLQLQTLSDAGHVSTTSLPFVTASDTPN